MRSASLLVSLAFFPGVWAGPEFTVVNRMPVVVQAPQKKAAVKTAEVGPLHSHRCPYCKTAWSHGASSHGNLGAHTCPNCGRVLPLPWYPLR